MACSCLVGCVEKKSKGISEYENTEDNISLKSESIANKEQTINDNSDELRLFNVIKRDFKDNQFLDVQSRAEDFYKKYKLSDKLDSVEHMYEKSMDKLEAQEMKEYGSLAFTRYKLHENPILNPNPKMSAPADQFLNRFTGRGSDFAKLVKNQLQEPDGFEYIETKYMNKNSGYIALVMRFKAKNGLGLVVEREALGKFDKITETFTDIKIRD
ncbi:hypothetical protein SAMN05660862_2222 [Sphingobacterium psychroaquaticum]|uniref:Uncharacterized protein n=2 Tax=Sphingobacterium psychroaquaticum TaxID=561061 RepID=A0A1X7JUD9_9SPHI|nr:hypothetical protein SAMN05660862_2222 [Sphingobacterium psychroaquaticum]